MSDDPEYERRMRNAKWLGVYADKLVNVAMLRADSDYAKMVAERAAPRVDNAVLALRQERRA